MLLLRGGQHGTRRAVLAGTPVHFALQRQTVQISRALAIQLRGAQIREAVRRESAQEGRQIVNLTRGEPQGFHAGVEEVISLSSFIEEFDDVL
jgi:hypothetical protein